MRRSTPSFFCLHFHCTAFIPAPLIPFTILYRNQSWTIIFLAYYALVFLFAFTLIYGLRGVRLCTKSGGVSRCDDSNAKSGVEQRMSFLLTVYFTSIHVTWWQGPGSGIRSMIIGVVTLHTATDTCSTHPPVLAKSALQFVKSTS